MSRSTLDQLLARLRAEAGSQVPVSALGRLRRTATAGARVGVATMLGRLRGAQANLGALSPDSLASLVESFGELKGVAMKAGQILSYVDASLTPEAREILAVLQVQSQPIGYETIERTIREDLGTDAGVLLAGMRREPTATASIGQVHRAKLEDGGEVAVKVRHPGIDAAIRADFKTAAVGRSLARILVPGANVAEIMVEAEARFLEECDYALEARRQIRFAELYAGHGTVTIPAVHTRWCGPRVLTTAWHGGLGLEAFLAANPTAATRERAARGLYAFYVGTLYRHGLFNADPHPGNLLFADDGRVTILDHGCVRDFDARTVAALGRLSRSVRADDTKEMQDALADIGMPAPGANFDVTRDLLRAFYQPLLTPGPHPIAADRATSLGETTRLKKKLLRMRLPGKLMFLFRIRFGLYAVLARMEASLDWARLEDELLS